MLCCIMFWCVLTRSVLLCYTYYVIYVLCCSILCSVLLCYSVLCSVMLCCSILCSVMLFYFVFCSVMLCCVLFCMLCFVWLCCVTSLVEFICTFSYCKICERQQRHWLKSQTKLFLYLLRILLKQHGLLWCIEGCTLISG